LQKKMEIFKIMLIIMNSIIIKVILRVNNNIMSNLMVLTTTIIKITNIFPMRQLVTI